MTPGYGDEPDLFEPYDCERDCLGRRDEDARRAARACKRPDLPAVKHRPTALALYIETESTPYMGRAPSRRPVVEAGHRCSVDWPVEAAEDGCPGAWYRTPFLESLFPFLRRRIDGGGRVPRPAYDTAPWQVQAAVDVFEAEQERALAHLADERERRRRSKREIAEAQLNASPKTARARARP